jgi:hypothetical protein
VFLSRLNEAAAAGRGSPMIGPRLCPVDFR